MNPGLGAFIISGPTAVGKGTVVKALKQRYPQIYVSVSATTRQPRDGETEGVDYFFVDDPTFDDLIENDGLLEWAMVHKEHRYGTPRQPVMDQLAAGKPTILEIDLQGARQVRRTMPDAKRVFLAPPSWDELMRRLRGRGTETEEEIARRLQTARYEMASADEFDIIIPNVTVENTVDQLIEFMCL